jgi:molecular chaperone DnaK (HSP70)
MFVCLGGYFVRAANVLRYLRVGFKESLCQGLDDCVKDVVITVPAYFGENQRKATLTAAIAAGFNPLSVLNEPTAAALAYTMEMAKQDHAAMRGDSKTALVFDFG